MQSAIAVGASTIGPRYPIPGVRYRSTEEAARELQAGNYHDIDIGETARRAAKAQPDGVAVVDPDGSLTFAELDEESESVAACLLQLGLQPGDRALFQLGTSRDYFVAFYGCMKAGIVPVCTLPQYREIEMLHFAKKTHARAFFVQADCNPNFDQIGFAEKIAATSGSVEHIVVVRGDRTGLQSLTEMAHRFRREEALARTAHIKPGILDVAVLQLSGGSTSLPKVIPRMHGEYLGATLHLSRRYGLSGSDVSLWSLPLVHNAGTLFVVLPVTLERRKLVLQTKLDIPEMLRLVGEHRVTFSGSIGPVAAKLLEVDDLARHDISSLRQFFALTRADVVEAHVGIPVGQMFGMTEGMVLASAPTAAQDIRHRTVGYPVCDSEEIRLLAPGTEDEVEFGAIGELCFRGPTTLTSYFDDEEANASSFTSQGFLRSGDLMRAHRIDGQVCYSFEGRIKDNINRGGEKIGAEEVEELAVRHPDIADVRVVAMPDPIYGEKVCAYVIPHIGGRAPDVKAFGDFLLELGIAKYKLPERVEVIDAFPLTRVGKADKAELRARIAAKIAAEAKGLALT